MLRRTFDNITFLPIFHYRLEFAAAVRETLLRDPPDAVAVEFPGTWREPLVQAVNRLPYLSLILGATEEGYLYLPVEPADAGLEAMRTARELRLPVELIDLDVAQYPLHQDPVPDPYVVRRLGYDEVMETYYAHARLPRGELDEQREIMMAHALQGLAAAHGRVVCVLGAAHLPGVLDKLERPQPRPFARAKPRELTLYNWSQQSSREFLSEAPFLAAAYERLRPAMREAAREGHAMPGVDREAESEALIDEARAAYAEQFRTEVDAQALRTLARFARKYARVDHQVVPDLYHLVVAARGVEDEEFGYEVWQRGSDYPCQDGSGLLPTIDLDEAFAHVEGRRLTLHRKLRRKRPQLARFSEKKRLRERHQGEWEARWSGRFICSHPPEDLVIEEYGRYLRRKARSMLSAGRTRVEPFRVSIKDGLDVRETLHNWHRGELYVREEQPLAGDVGAVAVVFDEDAGHDGTVVSEGERYPWLVTWLGEHNQESDMAFYATPAGEDVIGPGISRCEYGGFVMAYPPQRMFDIWSDPFFDMARGKPERLLLAALDYSEQRYVLYVAPRPPRSWFRTAAERMGKQVVYLPLGELNPRTLHRIRTFHVLEGHHVRGYADEYID